MRTPVNNKTLERILHQGLVAAELPSLAAVHLCLR